MVLLLQRRKFYAEGANVDTFFTATSARTAYKNHLKKVTSRKNSINGVVRRNRLTPLSIRPWISSYAAPPVVDLCGLSSLGARAPPHYTLEKGSAHARSMTAEIFTSSWVLT